MNELYIKIEGLNLARIVSKLVDEGVCLTQLKIKKTAIYFFVNARDLEKLKAICRKNHKNFYICKETKIKRFFLQFPYLLGVFLSIVISFAFFYSKYLTIYEIKVSVLGEKEYSLEKIDNVLLNNNILVGENKIFNSPKKIEKLLLENLDDLSGCEIYYDGAKLFISVVPATEKVEILTKDLLSKYNGIITKIEVYSGVKNAKVGDLVKEGDVLIKNDGGAQGKVLGKVYFSASQIYNENRQYFEETGNSKIIKSFSIANIFSINQNSQNKFENYKLSKIRKVIFKNLFLPVYCDEYVFLETKVVCKVEPYEKVREQIRENLKNEVMQKIPEGVEIKNIIFNEVKEGEYTKIDCFAETEISLI